MPISNPSSCSNCNIQNSNPSIDNNSTSSGSNNPDRITIQKRYNPGLLLNTNLNTNEAVSEVQNVSQQSRLDLGYLSQRRKMEQTVNQNTLNILKNLLDVDSEIVRVDKSVQKARKLARQSSAKKTVDITPKAVQQQVKISDEKKGRVQRSLSPEKKEKKKKTNEESRMRNRGYKSVGTDLASSSSFKAKFSILLQQNIATEKTIFEYDIPQEFDGRKVWSNYISDVRAQGICGSCWAFSSVFALETRLSIYSKGKYNYILSPAKMIFCGITIKESVNYNLLENLKMELSKGVYYDFKKNEDKKNEDIITYGCSGENLINAWQFLYRYGVPENDCFHYGDEENVGDDTVDLTNTDDLYYSCSELSSLTYDVCPATKKRMISHRAGGFYLVPGTKSEDKTKPQGSEYNIRKEIYKWGPCTSGMMVYQDFIDWNGIGIYEYDGLSTKVGGHAIVLMGWGEENGKKYWIVRNSWGSEWGDKGYFKILRGSNHCEIEENVIVGFPNIPAIRLFLDYPLLYEKEDLIIQNLWQIRDNGIKETTLEQLALGNIKDMNILKSNSVYSVKFFPNFYKFIAGEIIKENFHCDNNLKKNKTDNIVKILLLVFLLLVFYLV
jgi:cathepsin B